MSTPLEPGITKTETFSVTDDMSPPHLPMKVLSTPDMIGLIEGTCLQAVQPMLDEGSTTVGIHVCVSHDAAVPSGDKVDVAVELSAVDRRKLTFDVKVTHGDTQVSAGTHDRFIVSG